MANRNTRAKNNEAMKKRAAERKASGGDKKFKNPPRLNSPKDFSRNRNTPGYRKPAVATEKVVKVYKSELAGV